MKKKQVALLLALVLRNTYGESATLWAQNFLREETS